jgi:hypothetical protein
MGKVVSGILHRFSLEVALPTADVAVGFADRELFSEFKFVCDNAHSALLIYI